MIIWVYFQRSRVVVLAKPIVCMLQKRPTFNHWVSFRQTSDIIIILIQYRFDLFLQWEEALNSKISWAIVIIFFFRYKLPLFLHSSRHVFLIKFSKENSFTRFEWGECSTFVSCVFQWLVQHKLGILRTTLINSNRYFFSKSPPCLQNIRIIWHLFFFIIFNTIIFFNNLWTIAKGTNLTQCMNTNHFFLHFKSCLDYQ